MFEDAWPQLRAEQRKTERCARLFARLHDRQSNSGNAGNAGNELAHIHRVTAVAGVVDQLPDLVLGEVAIGREGDRHQFRFIVAPEDSAELSDLKPFIRDLMRQMESDLGTRLDWVAADHFNTGHPHSHIVLRGRDDEGQDLVIARDYISHGLRARAADLITRELGPETELEVARKLQQEVTAERFTRLDRAIVRDAPDGAPKLSAMPTRDPVWQAARMGRLRALERMGLAEVNRPGIAGGNLV